MSRKINGREQRIIVTGDADYLAKLLIASSIILNLTFGRSVNFTYGQFPQNTIRYESSDHGFKITMKQIPLQRMILCWIIPGIILLTGAIVLIRRMRK